MVAGASATLWSTSWQGHPAALTTAVAPAAAPPAVFGVSYYNNNFESIAAANAYIPKYQAKNFG